MQKTLWPMAWTAALLLIPASAMAGSPLICSFNPTAACCEDCGVSADVDGDGVVNGVDLGMVLGGWGPALTTGPVLDFNGDGFVSCFDHKFVLGNWGECLEVDPDLFDDDAINGQDISMLVASYGSCSHLSRGVELPLDLDNSGRVTQYDVDIVACFFGPAVPGYPNVDFAAPFGIVDAADQQVVRDALNTECPFDLNQNGLVEWSDVKVIIEKWP